MHLNGSNYAESIRKSGFLFQVPAFRLLFHVFIFFFRAVRECHFKFERFVIIL